MTFRRHGELQFDVHCYANGPEAPVYRIYVSDDLITERSFVWNGDTHYIEEHVILHAPIGQHQLRVENVTPELGTITIENILLDGLPPAGNTVFEIV